MQSANMEYKKDYQGKAKLFRQVIRVFKRFSGQQKPPVHYMLYVIRNL